MGFTSLRKRAVSAASVAVLGAAVASVMAASPAQAAAVYWQFKSIETGTCLTGGTSGVAWASSCTGSSNQQWDWVGDSGGADFPQLKNRATGQCLATDDKSNVNAVWTSSCTWTDGQRWGYNATTQQFGSALGEALKAYSDGSLHTVPGSYQAWVGWHN
ncbi:RICIN domain-containing protein [Streptomyces cocklensis]|nr:RICIN domain-containing protein [Actinacidiphila cocklensis]MDD1063242.1 RICIN domain-containing protein [Actinacidiphila cocklensis]WSX74409.1 RICIN domain-containing protein [Streptomyces sp. NBC_00899]